MLLLLVIHVYFFSKIKINDMVVSNRMLSFLLLYVYIVYIPSWSVYVTLGLVSFSMLPCLAW